MRLQCEDCKFYEPYHKHPNPLATSRHWCQKCGEEIRLVKINQRGDKAAWLPKACYFNGYFEESEESKRRRQQRYILDNEWCQIED